MISKQKIIIPTPKEFAEIYLPMKESRNEKYNQQQAMSFLKYIKNTLRGGILSTDMMMFDRKQQQIVTQNLESAGWYVRWTRLGNIKLSSTPFVD